jgi:hypothetical protein
VLHSYPATVHHREEEISDLLRVVLIIFHSFDPFVCCHFPTESKIPFAMQALLLISSVTLALLSWPCIKLAKNYIKARKIGLPVLITPISFFNFLWLLGNHRLAPLLKALPFRLGNFVDHSGFSWYRRSLSTSCSTRARILCSISWGGASYSCRPRCSG